MKVSYNRLWKLLIDKGIQGCTAHLALKIGGKYNEKNCDYFRRSFHRI